jgi:hypothetical protein
LATLPTPDWIGSNSGGSLPWRTSWSRNSRIWPAIAFDVASGAAKVVLRSGALVSTTAITFSGSQRNVVSPILSPDAMMGIGFRCGGSLVP